LRASCLHMPPLSLALPCSCHLLHTPIHNLRSPPDISTSCHRPGVKVLHYWRWLPRLGLLHGAGRWDALLLCRDEAGQAGRGHGSAEEEDLHRQLTVCPSVQLCTYGAGWKMSWKPVCAYISNRVGRADMNHAATISTWDGGLMLPPIVPPREADLFSHSRQLCAFPTALAALGMPAHLNWPW